MISILEYLLPSDILLCFGHYLMCLLCCLQTFMKQEIKDEFHRQIEFISERNNSPIVIELVSWSVDMAVLYDNDVIHG